MTGPGEIRSEIGKARRPIEDERLVQGHGQYVSDLQRPGMLHLAFARSPYAHARIARIDRERAKVAPGVVAVFTSADFPRRALSRQPFGNAELLAYPQPFLADGTVRFVGEPVVAIVAASAAEARDAVDLLEIEYEALPVVGDPATAPDGPELVHPDLGTNVAFTARRGSGDVDAAFAAADRVVTLRLAIPRLAAVPMETIGVLVEGNSDGSDADAPLLTVWCTTQAPWRVHDALAGLLGIPGESIRVIAPDVGGGFGVRGPVYVEYVITAFAAQRLGRPVRYLATRSEDFQVTQGSRETLVDAALAATADGRFLALRARATINLGAYASGPGSAGRIISLTTGAYDIPIASVEVSGVYTNTGPTGAYRGAGRPEAAFIVERLVEEMARALGTDPIALRRRNFVRPDAFPYQTPLGTVYDSGDYAAALDRALAVADYAGLRAASPGASGELLGVGLASYIEPTGGGWESGRVWVEPDGRVVAVSGSVPQGQDHQTTFAQIIAGRLGVRFEAVTVRQGDTADGLPGIGTFGSRSVALGGGALTVAADEVFEKARRVAAYLLEAAPEDLVAAEGSFSVVGSPGRAVPWAEVAARVASSDLPPELAVPLDARTRFEMPREAFASGSCVAVVGVDPRTGVVRLRRLVLVHDCGNPINPLLVDAQLHGGLAQGAGEALGEWLRFDPAGQLLSGTLLDYWLPHADDLPAFELAEVVSPSPLNRLGAKGVGEAGTIAAPPAVLHAVLDALRPLGVTALDLPLTPERVWLAIQAAR